MKTILKEDFKNLRNTRETVREQFNSEVLDFVKDYIQNKMRLQILRVDPKEDLSEVMRVKTPKGTEELSVKLITSTKANKKEITDWPRLKHPNILPLLHYRYILQFDSHIFITQSHVFCLKYYLRNEAFLNDVNSPRRAQKWIKEILTGLEYLHKKNYYHRNITLNNIVLSNDFSAIITNFSVLDSAVPPKRNQALNKYCLSKTYVPLKGCNKLAVDGVSFDIWCLGVLALDVFTNRYLRERVPEERTNWHEEMYPIIFEALEINTFNKCLKSAFPSCNIGEEISKTMRNFIVTCHKVLPKDTPSANLLLHHKYFEIEMFEFTPTQEDKGRNENKALSRQGINAVRRVWGWLRKISTAIVQILHSTEDLGN